VERLKYAPVGKEGIIGRQLVAIEKRGMPCSSMILSSRHLRQSRTASKPPSLSSAGPPGAWGRSLSYQVQRCFRTRQVGGSAGCPRPCLRQQLRQIAQLAVGGGDDVPVRTPGNRSRTSPRNPTMTSRPTMTIQKPQARPARVASASSGARGGPATSAGRGLSACRNRFTPMDCREQVSFAENGLGDHLFERPAFSAAVTGSGQPPGENCPEDGDQRHLRVRRLDGPQPRRNPHGAACKHRQSPDRPGVCGFSRYGRAYRIAFPPQPFPSGVLA